MMLFCDYLFYEQCGYATSPMIVFDAKHVNGDGFSHLPPDQEADHFLIVEGHNDPSPADSFREGPFWDESEAVTVQLSEAFDLLTDVILPLRPVLFWVDDLNGDLLAFGHLPSAPECKMLKCFCEHVQLFWTVWTVICVQLLGLLGAEHTDLFRCCQALLRVLRPQRRTCQVG